LANGTEEGAQQLFGLEPGVPVVLVMGGGTGSLQINRFVEKSLPYLTRYCQVIHVTGKDKEGVPGQGKKIARYHAYEFLDKELPAAFAAASLVVCRAGFSTISELSFLGKATLLIPIPHSHQEQNADYVEHHGAAHVIRRDARAKHFSDAIEHIILHPEIREDLEKKMRGLLPRGATKRMMEIIDSMV
jgi:UDP-N-acetylglucosamine--N-acetylmuramyl-(pentapeptide) pyrophosphoryl-undecaprenol N-acetylglucosamine transferase